jgi:hypothetical protein
VWLLAQVRPIASPLRVAKHVLVDTGYLRSNRVNRPVDASGDPVPWFTFPAIAYLRQLDLSATRIFEYGSGNSTLFWQRHAAKVVAVENDPTWHAVVEKSLDSSIATLVLAADEDSYVGAIDQEEGRWDVIIIDGAHRRACAKRAIDHLSAGGFMILDNADWYPDLAEWLRGRGLIEVDFSGPGPINFYSWTTSVFFHRDAQPAPAGAQPQRPLGGIVPTLDEKWL